jgi:hypothetical protein
VGLETLLADEPFVVTLEHVNVCDSHSACLLEECKLVGAGSFRGMSGRSNAKNESRGSEKN